jgi:hypothetical protein
MSESRCENQQMKAAWTRPCMTDEQQPIRSSSIWTHFYSTTLKAALPLLTSSRQTKQASSTESEATTAAPHTAHRATRRTNVTRRLRQAIKALCAVAFSSTPIDIHFVAGPLRISTRNQ